MIIFKRGPALSGCGWVDSPPVCSKQSDCGAQAKHRASDNKIGAWNRLVPLLSEGLFGQGRVRGRQSFFLGR